MCVCMRVRVRDGRFFFSVACACNVVCCKEGRAGAGREGAQKGTTRGVTMSFSRTVLERRFKLHCAVCVGGVLGHMHIAWRLKLLRSAPEARGRWADREEKNEQAINTG